MAFVKRYNIQRLVNYRAEYYDGCETTSTGGWSTDADEAFEFTTQAKANRRADRVGGEVCEYQRYSPVADRIHHSTTQFSIAAE